MELSVIFQSKIFIATIAAVIVVAIPAAVIAIMSAYENSETSKNHPTIQANNQPVDIPPKNNENEGQPTTDESESQTTSYEAEFLNVQPEGNAIKLPPFDRDSKKNAKKGVFSFFKIREENRNAFLEYYKLVRPTVVKDLGKELYSLREDARLQKFFKDLDDKSKMQLIDIIILHAFWVAEHFYSYLDPISRLQRKTYKNGGLFHMLENLILKGIEITEMPYDVLVFFTELDGIHFMFCKMPESIRPLSDFLPPYVTNITFNRCNIKELPKPTGHRYLKYLSWIEDEKQIEFAETDISNLEKIKLITLLKSSITDEALTKLPEAFKNKLRLLKVY